MSDQGTTQQQGVIAWDNAHGHVCSCSRTEHFTELGAPLDPTYAQTVRIEAYAPRERPVYSEDGRRVWQYRCEACGALTWSSR